MIDQRQLGVFLKRTRKQVFFASATVLLLAVTVTILAQTAQTAKPKRINQAIELLAEGQPIYYTGSHSGTTGTYEQGVKDAQTKSTCAAWWRVAPAEAVIEPRP